MPAMTPDETETLLTVLAYDAPMPAAELGRVLYRMSGPPNRETAYETGRRRAQPLVAAGALARPVPGRYLPTEKGRIAAALLISKDPDLRAAFVDGAATPPGAQR